jgi:hypothetical protein
MDFRTCMSCRSFNHPLNTEFCKTCDGFLVDPADHIWLEMEVQERYEKKLMGLVSILAGVAILISALVTHLTNGSFFTQRSPSTTPTPHGSTFYEIGFALWIGLVFLSAQFIKKPPSDDQEACLRYLGHKPINKE